MINFGFCRRSFPSRGASQAHYNSHIFDSHVTSASDKRGGIKIISAKQSSTLGERERERESSGERSDLSFSFFENLQLPHYEEGFSVSRLPFLIYHALKTNSDCGGRFLPFKEEAEDGRVWSQRGFHLVKMRESCIEWRVKSQVKGSARLPWRRKSHKGRKNILS